MEAGLTHRTRCIVTSVVLRGTTREPRERLTCPLHSFGWDSGGSDKEEADACPVSCPDKEVGTASQANTQ